MNYRVIALDLDGTLLTPEKTILPESLQALARARAAGYQVLIVTGRHHVAIRPFYQELELSTPAICCNGTYLYDCQAKRVLQSNPIPAQQARQILDLMQHHHIDGFMYVDDAMLYQTPTDLVLRMQRWAQRQLPHLQPDIQQVHSLRDALVNVNHVWKFALSDNTPARLHAFDRDLKEQLALEGEWSWQDQLDVAQSGNNKGQRLTEWATAMGIAMSEVVAFGDNYNDVSMLQAAGLGVAMGNAEPGVKACAKLITDCNTEPGIARIIDQYLL